MKQEFLIDNEAFNRLESIVNDIRTGKKELAICGAGEWNIEFIKNFCGKHKHFPKPSYIIDDIPDSGLGVGGG